VSRRLSAASRVTSMTPASRVAAIAATPGNHPHLGRSKVTRPLQPRRRCDPRQIWVTRGLRDPHLGRATSGDPNRAQIWVFGGRHDLDLGRATSGDPNRAIGIARSGRNRGHRNQLERPQRPPHGGRRGRLIWLRRPSPIACLSPDCLSHIRPLLDRLPLAGSNPSIFFFLFFNDKSLLHS